MNCTRILQLLSAFLDDELTPEERRQVRQHLFICPQCQNALAELTLVHRMLGGLRSIEPPRGLIEDVRQQALRPIVTVLPSPKRWSAGLWALAAAAAIVAVVFVNGAIHRGGPTEYADDRPNTIYGTTIPYPDEQYFPTGVKTSSNPVMASPWRVIPASQSSFTPASVDIEGSWLFPPEH